jgi:hypothetical protein
VKRIRPALDVTVVARPIEAVPLGQLRADAILACVDGRAARQYLNQAARHLGVPLIDAGVYPDAQLARVSVFLSGGDHACLECTWDQADYDVLEQSYPCRGDAPDAASTGAPAHLGALAAAMQALECQLLLDGRTRPVEGSYEIVIDAATRRQWVTRFARNPSCRLADHAPWEIRRLSRAPNDMTVRQALALGGARGSSRDARLSLDGIPFVRGLRCLGCGRRTPMLRLRRAATASARACRSCGGRVVAGGPDIVSTLAIDDMPRGARAYPLRSLGFEPGDVFAVSHGERTRYFEVNGRSPGGPRQ